MNKVLTGTMADWAKNAGHLSFSVFMHLFIASDENGVVHDMTVGRIADLAGVSRSTAKNSVRQMEEDSVIVRTLLNGSKAPYDIQILDFDRKIDRDDQEDQNQVVPDKIEDTSQIENPGNTLEKGALSEVKIEEVKSKPKSDDLKLNPIDVIQLLQVEFGLPSIRANKTLRYFDSDYIMEAVENVRNMAAENPDCTQLDREKWLLGFLYRDNGKPIASEAPAPQQPAQEPSSPDFNVSSLMQKIDAGSFLSPAEYEVVPLDIKTRMRFDQQFWDKTHQYRYFLPKG